MALSSLLLIDEGTGGKQEPGPPVPMQALHQGHTVSTCPDILVPGSHGTAETAAKQAQSLTLAEPRHGGQLWEQLVCPTSYHLCIKVKASSEKE